MAHGKTCAAANLRFHGDKSNERVASVIVTCGGEWRKIVIDKSFYAVPKKESRLLVAHAFEINVYSSASTKKPVDSIEAVPKIGVCDDNQQCTAEVEYEVGGVIFTFKSKIDPNQSDL